MIPRFLQSPDIWLTLFEDVATLSGNPKKAANWFMVEGASSYEGKRH